MNKQIMILIYNLFVFRSFSSANALYDLIVCHNHFLVILYDTLSQFFYLTACVDAKYEHHDKNLIKLDKVKTNFIFYLNELSFVNGHFGLIEFYFK